MAAPGCCSGLRFAATYILCSGRVIIGRADFYLTVLIIEGGVLVVGRDAVRLTDCCFYVN